MYPDKLPHSTLTESDANALWTNPRAWLAPLAVLVGYALVFIPLQRVLGAAVTTLAMFPVVVAAWRLGIIGGVLMGAACLPLHILLLNLAGSNGWVMMLRTPGGLLGSALLVVGGGIVGHLSDVHRRERRTFEELLQAQQQRKLSEERYRRLTDLLPDGVAIHRGGRVIFANRAAATIIGAEDPDVLIGKSALDVIHPESRELVLERIRRGLELGEMQPAVEEVFVRLDGTLVDVEVSAVPFIDEGEPAMLVVFQDITERKRTQKEIQRRAEEMTALYESSRSLMAKTSLHDILQVITESAQRIFAAPGVGLYLYDPETETLEVKLAVHSTIPLGMKLGLGEGLAGKVALARQSMRIDDYMHWEGRSPQYEGVPVRATMEAPLIYQDELLGVLAVHEVGDSERQFTDEDERLLSLFAAQAAAAIQNARLFEEVRQRVQELEALAAVSAALRAAETRAEMPTIILDQLMSLLDAVGAAFAAPRIKGAEIVIEQARGAWAHWRGRRLEPGKGIFGRVIAEGKMLLSQNMASDPAIACPDLIDKPYSGVCIPLRVQDMVVAAIFLGREAPFTQADLRLLTAVADIAANALRRAELHEDTERRLRYMSALFAVGQVISRSIELDVVLDAILEQLTAKLNAHAATILLYHPDENELRYGAGKGFRNESIKNVRLKLGKELAGQAAVERRILHIDDLNAVSLDCDIGDKLAGEGFVAYTAAPLLAGRELVGVIEAFHRQSLQPDDEWLDFLQTLAGHAAIALENARLYEELRRHATELDRRVAERTAELQRANEQLRQAQEELRLALEQERELSELKSRILSTSSHEFNTPLTAILSSTELLEHYGRQWPEEKQLRHYQRIKTAVRRMTALLDKILLISRDEADRLPFNPQPIDVVEVCADIIEVFRLGAGAQHRLILDLGELDADRPLIAELDPDLFRSILDNLLGNAIKYSPTGSEVRLSLGRDDDSLALSVADRGVGVPVRDLPHLFEAFHRGSNVEAKPGAGLGLSIVYRAVRKHRGHIEIANREGGGTLVTVRLPLKAGHHEDADEKQP